MLHTKLLQEIRIPPFKKTESLLFHSNKSLLYMDSLLMSTRKLTPIRDWSIGQVPEVLRRLVNHSNVK